MALHQSLALLLSLCALSTRPSTAQHCVAWRQTGGCTPDGNREAHSDLPCSANVPEGSSGYCECEGGRKTAKVGCKHRSFRCEDECAGKSSKRRSTRFNKKIDADFDWMKGSTWHWNGWRNVEFRADGGFVAPNCNPDEQDCKWSAHDGRVYVKWSSDGLHTLIVSSDKKKMSGTRHDGDQCSATFVSLAEKEIDPYEVLEVDEDATEKEIKKAYRSMSLKYHPDKNPGDDEALKKFNSVRDAYEIIGDEEKRLLYDTGGLEAIEEAKKQEQGGGQMNPLQMFFGGQQQQGGKGKKGGNFQMEHEVPLEDMYNGGSVSVNVKRRVVCRGCHKNPNKPKCQTCGRCPSETRMVQKRMGNMIIQQQEEVRSKHKCKEEEKTLEHTIERGMAAGQELTFERMSEQTPGEIPGDVVLKLKQKRHSRFERRGDDLHYTLRISLQEALLGYTKKIQHLDGREVEISSKSVTQYGYVKKLRGEGMPKHNYPSEFGTMHVKVLVDFPKTLSEEQRAALQDAL